MQSGKWSIIRSLYIDNKTRNPKARGTHECINSVFYNWGTNGYIMGDTEGLSECNLIGNYIGSAYALRKGGKFIRPMMILVLIFLLAKITFDLFNV